MSEVVNVITHLFEMLETSPSVTLKDWLEEAIETESLSPETRYDIRTSIARLSE